MECTSYNVIPCEMRNFVESTIDKSKWNLPVDMVVITNAMVSNWQVESGLIQVII